MLRLAAAAAPLLLSVVLLVVVLLLAAALLRVVLLLRGCYYQLHAAALLPAAVLHMVMDIYVVVDIVGRLREGWLRPGKVTHRNSPSPLGGGAPPV